MNQKKEILIVDDEVEFRLDLAEILVDHGYKVTTAANGAEAIRHIETEGRVPDLVTVDVNMPEKDGVAFGEELSRLRPDIPMIMISGFLPRQINNLKCVKAFLSKPLDKYAFIDIIENQLRI